MIQASVFDKTLFLRSMHNIDFDSLTPKNLRFISAHYLLISSLLLIIDTLLIDTDMKDMLIFRLH